MPSVLRRCLLSLLLLLPAACAVSPQTVGIATRVDAPADLDGRGRPIALEVVDARTQQAFGNRGGIYATAYITPRNSVADALRSAVAERLTASGFQVQPASPSAPLRLRVEVDRIDYQAAGQPVVNEVRALAALRAEGVNGGRRVSVRQQANSLRQVLGPPAAEENEVIINEVIAQALRRLLQDPSLRGVLGN